MARLATNRIARPPAADSDRRWSRRRRRRLALLDASEYMVRGADTFRLITDHLGSVRLVVNTATGSVAQRIDYDEWGVVTNDTSPGLQPFGFAGGLYDADTRLVRFGARDYDAETGRWTSKDPIGFAGDGTNLYEYAMSVVTQLTDPSGMATYICRKPLNQLGGTDDNTNQRNGPDVPGNPLYHEYICTIQQGKVVCGGQSSGGKPYGPGQPSDDHYEWYRCKQVDPDNACLENCLNDAILDRNRPYYGLIGPGTNCQEWAEDKYSMCKKRCGGK